MTRALVDIGNTRVKYAIVGGDTAVAADSDIPVSARLHGEFSTEVLFDELVEQDAVEWLICSVNQYALGRLQKLIEVSRPKDIVHVVAAVDLPVELQIDEPNRVGVDRVCAAIGALSLCAPDRDAIVVDAGTAVTIDVITSKSEFLGGVIIPGVSLALKSLRTGTGALPHVTVDDGSLEPPSAIGKSTEGAIRKGVVFSLRGGVQSIVNRFREERRNRADVFVTGGDARLFAADLPDCHVSSDLVLRGLAQSRKRTA